MGAKMKTFLYVLGWIWGAPQELAGFLMALYYRPYNPVWIDGVLHCTVARLIGFKGTVGQTWGRVMYRTPEAGEWNLDHEMRHVRQSDMLGPFFGLAYLVAGIISLVQGKGFYRGNWFEIDAARAADAGVSDGN